MRNDVSRAVADVIYAGLEPGQSVDSADLYRKAKALGETQLSLVQISNALSNARRAGTSKHPIVKVAKVWKDDSRLFVTKYGNKIEPPPSGSKYPETLDKLKALIEKGQRAEEKLRVIKEIIDG